MSELLCVEILDAKPNPMFTETQRASVRFLRYNKMVACAHCGRKRRVLWTMLCAFRSIVIGPKKFSIDVHRDGKAFPPLTPVCGTHPLAPDFPPDQR